MFDWTLYTGNLKWLPSCTIYLTKHGSQAYGTALPTSDTDIRGVAIAPKEYYLGCTQVFKQAEQKDPDLTIFELRKFLAMASECNPNVLELLYTDPEDHLERRDPLGNTLLEMREWFLTTRVRHTFSGYATQQLRRINTHYRWLKNPPTAKPTREEFKLPERTLIPKDQLAAAQAAIQKKMDEWSWHDLEHLDPVTRQSIKDEFFRRLCEITQWAWTEVEDKTWRAAANTLGYDTNFIRLMDLERQYTNRLSEWNKYQEWKAKRNPARAVLEEKFGYDCYLDDTEFLTIHGWKRYDEIPDDLPLATLNQQTGGIEYHLAVERISKQYDGPIYFFETQDTACAVTPNHRMWVSEVRGGSANKLGTAYDESRASWKIVKAEQLLVGRRYSFHVRTAGEGSTLDEDEQLLIIVGAYVSEGNVQKRLKNGKPSVLKFSQKKGGRQIPYLDRLLEWRWDVRRFSIKRKEKSRKTPIIEKVYTLANRKIAEKVARECGEGSLSKRLPIWAFRLTKEKARFLLDVLVAGDGTDRRFSRIYSTSSKQLADDVQALAVVAGATSLIWGPYPDKRRPGSSPMYQVYLGPDAYSRIISRGRFSHITTEKVSNRRIVCFTVPNEVLVTRRNGKVAIQGNTKHGMHLVRLLRMCREILETGEVLVRRPDAQDLLGIRHGSWDYFRLVEWAGGQDKEMAEVAKNSKLPKHPDLDRINDRCIDMVEYAHYGQVFKP